MSIARRHHFVPKCYLAGFTDTGEVDGKVYAKFIDNSKAWRTTPLNIGCEKDFNRIDLPGKNIDALEVSFGQFEGIVAPILKEMIKSRAIPSDEEFSYILNLMSIMAVKNPKFRRATKASISRLGKTILNTLASDHKLYEHHFHLAKKAGFIPSDSELSFDQFKTSADSAEYEFRFDTMDNLNIELRAFKPILKFLGRLDWNLAFTPNEATYFITSDHPVVISGRTHKSTDLFYDTSINDHAFMAISSHVLLFGEGTSKSTSPITLSSDQVSRFNNIIKRNAFSQIYCANEFTD